MTLTVLNVAYPLAPVGPDVVGGAEQVLSALDTALVELGHRSLVVACEDSRPHGQLIPIPAFAPPFTDEVRQEAEAATRHAIESVLREEVVDLVHIHAVDFKALLPSQPVPVLVTLHLPLAFYGPDDLSPQRPHTYFNSVSQTQHASLDLALPLIDPIPNGVDLARFGGFRKRDFALFLGRICPEKGVHLAIEAAEGAGIPLLIAGQVFGYETHLRYFKEKIRPRLNRNVRFLGPLTGRAKRRVLAAARCLLLPALVEETSSLVAREAAASGTPVVAFRRGALVEAVVEGETGFLVDGVEEMTNAIAACNRLAPEACRRKAQAEFSLSTMVDGYLNAYRHIAPH